MNDTVRMRFPDGSELDVPKHGIRAASQAGARIANVRLRSPNGQERDVNAISAPRLIAAGAHVVEPGSEGQDAGLGGALLNVARKTAAGAPMMAAQLAPMAIPGGGLVRAGARLATAFGAGAGADALSRGVMGQPQDPGSSAVMGGINAAWQAPFEGAAALTGPLARVFAKGAFGATRPDIPEAFLEAKTPLSTEGMRADQAAIDAHTGRAQRVIQGPIGQGRKFSGKPLEAIVEGYRQRALKYGLLSEGGEKSAEDAYGVMLNKLRALYPNKTIPARSGGSANPDFRNIKAQLLGKAPSAAGTTTVSVPEIAATDIDGINQFAESAAKKLFEARKAQKIDDPGQEESMYRDIANATNTMLNTLPFVERNNLSASRRIDLKRAKFKALERSEGKPESPLGALMHLGQSPEGLGRTALFLNNPALADAIRTAPRQVGFTLLDALSRNQ